MAIDLDRALYSHCEHHNDTLPAHLVALLEELIRPLVGAPVRMTRHVTYLQGAVTLPNHETEFRLHTWLDLPQGHPSFCQADRGLACLIRPVSAEGLFGPTLGGVGWLGRPLGSWSNQTGDDWVDKMIRAQGYISIQGAEWMGDERSANAQALLGLLLGRHLQGMTNHIILEERLQRR